MALISNHYALPASSFISREDPGTITHRITRVRVKLVAEESTPQRKNVFTSNRDSYPETCFSPFNYKTSLSPSQRGGTDFKALACLDPPLPGKAIKLFFFLLCPKLCLCISVPQWQTEAEFQQQLWCRPAPVAPIQLLAWELPYASTLALKSKKQNKIKQKKTPNNQTKKTRIVLGNL